MSRTPQTYKERKEAFVSNLSGGTILEINAVTLVAPAAVLLWSALQSRKSFFTPYLPASLITDFLLNVVAILFATTLYSSTPILLNILLISPSIFILLSPKRNQPTQKAKPPTTSLKSPDGAAENVKASSNKLDPVPFRPFLTSYRGTMMIATCMAILAVDFGIFPRRFAKVENWGTSLMDLGVGSFVFSGGVVSTRSILKSQGPSSSNNGSLPKRLLGSARHTIPLLVLGLVRLYSVKGLDYAEHVTEYGVHWNFFFTLAFLGPFVEIFHSLTAIIPSYDALSSLIGIGYQVVLESTDLKKYILVSPRGPSLLSKNREGVFSLLGYLAIFLAGRATGLRVMPRETSSSTTKTPYQARKSLLIRQATWSIVWTALFALNSLHLFGFGAGIPVSRRLANLPYVFWVVAFNNWQLFLFCFLETLFFPSVYKATDKPSEEERSRFATSRILHAFNNNGLAIFLIANLLTGTVNMGMNTLDADRNTAMVVLVGYAAVLTGVALAMDKWNLKLKL
ncbi:GPI-anchored wall transfer protein [Histoplasma capsulatum H143]|uniref:GPI-anchored wall transfer protein n=1 Tax=Ajellomyces capsulatus (strain H143) TaxID=544712 RepID=C6HNY1_AJECH|nr:GPI-anchored wall transfer protein [Histoplasma capsulatum H143]